MPRGSDETRFLSLNNVGHNYALMKLAPDVFFFLKYNNTINQYPVY